MKIIATSDWHLGNLFHGNERIEEHRHFLQWLLYQINREQPDALLIAGDIFDNGNPSAASQSTYYEFLADATKTCPSMQTVIIAGNHDSASRLEAPRALLTRHKVEIRGNITRKWSQADGRWHIDYDDLMIPITGKEGDKAVILAVPYLRSDITQGSSYSQGVNNILRKLTYSARERYPEARTIMMAHLYAKGSEIAKTDASEKIIIGGQEEVLLEGWDKHPDYMTCGHIHKRQHIWGTDWARYSGSVLPMSFAEIDYRHGVDMITFTEENIQTVFLEYIPQHKLRILPEDNAELTPNKLKKLIEKELPDRKDGKLGEDFIYLMIKVKLDKVSNDDIKTLESLIETKNAVLCKIQKIIPSIDITTISGDEHIRSIDDILNRDPMDTLKETFTAQKGIQMSEHQEQMLRQLLGSINQ